MVSAMLVTDILSKLSIKDLSYCKPKVSISTDHCYSTDVLSGGEVHLKCYAQIYYTDRSGSKNSFQD